MRAVDQFTQTARWAEPVPETSAWAASRLAAASARESQDRARQAAGAAWGQRRQQLRDRLDQARASLSATTARLDDAINADDLGVARLAVIDRDIYERAVVVAEAALAGHETTRPQ